MVLSERCQALWMLSANSCDGFLGSPISILTSCIALELKRQAADAILRLPRSGEGCNQIDNAVQVISVNSPPIDERKGCIEPHEVFNDWNDTCASSKPPRLPAACAIRTPNEDTNSPTLTGLLIERAKDVFCRQGEGTIGTPVSFYSYGCHAMLVCTAGLQSSIGAMVRNSLRPHLLYLVHHKKLVKHLSERRLCDTMRRAFYWTYVANKV